MTQPYSAATTPYSPDPAVYVPKVRIPILKRGRAVFAGGTDVTPDSPMLATLTTGIPLPSVEVQESLFMAGACPMLYDGYRVHEAGFNYYPEASYLSENNVTDGQLTTLGVYSWIFVWEWFDAKGKLHRSAPSVPVTHTLVTGSNDSVTFNVSPMTLTDKQGVGIRDSIKLVGYRTASGGTTHYRETAVATGDNRLADGTAGLSDVYIGGVGTSDATLISAEVLYTVSGATGGPLENQAYPSTSLCCVHQRRTFTVIQGDQNFIQYTDEADDRFIAVGSNEVYQIPVPPEGGSVVGIASMDDKLIIFCQHRIYYIFGEGPNRLGTANGYSLPQICSAKMGALGGCQESIVLAPEGLWFMSSSGSLRLLTRGLTIGENEGGFIGVESDGLIPASFTRIQAATIDAKSQVRWYLSDGTVVVWDYQRHQWSRCTNHTSTGGVVSARGLFWHSDGTNLFSSNTAAGGLDNATTTTQVVESAWMALADVQGFQRIYKLLLLGQAISACTVEVAVGYDYSDTWIDGKDLGTRTMITAVGAGVYAFSGINFPAVGQKFTGGTSGATGIVSSLGALTSTLEYNDQTDEFAVGEAIVGTTSGATAVIVAIDDDGDTGTLTIAPTNHDSWQPGEEINGSVGLAYAVGTATANVGGSHTATLTPVVGAFTTGETVTLRTIFKYAVSGAVNPLQLEHPMHIQQCEAMRFRLTITPGSSAEAIRLTNFGLSVGLKKGLFKIPSSKRF